MNNYNNALITKSMFSLQKQLNELQQRITNLESSELSVSFINDKRSLGINPWNSVCSVDNNIVTVGSLIGYYNLGIINNGVLTWLNDSHIGVYKWDSVCSNKANHVVAVGKNAILTDDKQSYYILGKIENNNVTWTSPKTLGNNVVITNVCYADQGRVVAIGYKANDSGYSFVGTIDEKNDTITWKNANNGLSGSTWFTACYADKNRIVAIGADNTTLTDGYYNIGTFNQDGDITWGTATVLSRDIIWRSICYNNDTVVVVGTKPGDNNSGYYIIGTISPDDKKKDKYVITWSEPNVIGKAAYYSICYTYDGLFVAIGYNSNENKGYYTFGVINSENSIKWSEEKELSDERWNSVDYVKDTNTLITVGGNTRGYYSLGQVHRV